MDSDPAPESIQAAGKGLIPFSEVQKHNSPEDCWVVIEGKVYDLTEVSCGEGDGTCARSVRWIV